MHCDWRPTVADLYPAFSQQQPGQSLVTPWPQKGNSSRLRKQMDGWFVAAYWLNCCSSKLNIYVEAYFPVFICKNRIIKKEGYRMTLFTVPVSYVCMIINYFHFVFEVLKMCVNLVLIPIVRQLFSFWLF